MQVTNEPIFFTKQTEEKTNYIWPSYPREYNKSVNPQYITLVCWDAGTKDSSTKHLMFQVSFFFTILFKKNYQFIFYSFIIKIKSFECPKSIRNNDEKIMLGTSDAWSISLLF